MKRVKAACICQALHFMPKEDVGQDYAAQLVRERHQTIKLRLKSTTQPTK